MDITACDGCGKQSPDENAKGGPYIANSWTEVTVNFGRRSHGEKKLIFCQECLPHETVAAKLAKFLRGIFN